MNAKWLLDSRNISNSHMWFHDFCSRWSGLRAHFRPSCTTCPIGPAGANGSLASRVTLLLSRCLLRLKGTSKHRKICKRLKMTINDRDKAVQLGAPGSAANQTAPRKLLKMVILHVRKTIETHQSKSLRPA